MSDESGLQAAIGAAGPGDVIAIDGVIPITVAVVVATPGLTLTCLTPGSGLDVQKSELAYAMDIAADGVTIDGLTFVTSVSLAFAVIWVEAADVTLSHNTIVSPSLSSPLAASIALWFADRAVVSHNTVECSRLCIFGFTPSDEATIAHNEVHASGDDPLLIGVGVQRSTRARIEANTIITDVPSSPNFGGLSVFGGSGHVVTDNVVAGPWGNSLRLLGASSSVVEGNRLEGAARYGMLFPFATDNHVSNNRVVDAGEAAALVTSESCYNVFIGNNFERNGDVEDISVVFAVRSGGNTLLGNGRKAVDSGDWDCDGDGVSDPNIISGDGQALAGVNLGEIVSEGIPTILGVAVR